MKKMGTFALLVCLFVLAVAAVMSVRDPVVADSIVAFFKTVGEGIAAFAKNLAEAFKIAFTA
ncbi:MAG: hypothetical protein LBB67_04800 [Oscillospiraceae bacterium]|jgi:hypothetical protein|nr:hypothetical protein [Oscillospiraceae bacterium]